MSCVIQGAVQRDIRFRWSAGHGRRPEIANVVTGAIIQTAAPETGSMGGRKGGLVYLSAQKVTHRNKGDWQVNIIATETKVSARPTAHFVVSAKTHGGTGHHWFHPHHNNDGKIPDGSSLEAKVSSWFKVTPDTGVTSNWELFSSTWPSTVIIEMRYAVPRGPNCLASFYETSIDCFFQK